MSRAIKTLEGIIADVRSETKRDRDRALGQDEYENIKYLVQSEQRRLWLDYQWRFLRKVFLKTVPAGEQFIDIPAGLSLEKMATARVHFGNQWLDLAQGIDERDYALYDSDDGQTADPILKWDIVDTQDDPDAGAQTQIEVWPIPVTDQDTKWWGTAELGKFVDDNDNCTLDATLLTYYTAAALEPDRANLLQKANAHFRNLRAGESRRTGGNKINFNAERMNPPYTARKRIVVLSGS